MWFNKSNSYVKRTSQSFLKLIYTTRQLHTLICMLIEKLILLNIYLTIANLKYGGGARLWLIPIAFEMF